MFKEILKLIPKLEAGDAQRLESSLNSRFARVAKRFGRGLVTTLKGGGIAGAVTAILDKLLNPFQEIKSTIDTALGRADDLETMSKQFGTNSASLFKLQALGRAKGLDPNELNVLLTKFQTSVAEAIADPNKATSVRKFAKPGQDTVEAFFSYIQSLGALPNDKQVLAQSEVFGEKQIGKMSEFLKTSPAEFGALLKAFQLPADDKLRKLIGRTGALSDYRDALSARDESKHFLRVSEQIDGSKIKGLSESEQFEQAIQRDRLKWFNKSRFGADAMELLVFQVQKQMFEALGFSKGDVAGSVNSLLKSIKNIESALVKGAGKAALRGVNPFGKEE